MQAQLSKIHYIPPLTSAAQGNANPENQYVYISTPSDTNVNYTIELVGQPTANISGTITKTNPDQVYLGSGEGQLFVNSNTTASVHSNKGYIIHADDVIYVSIRMLGGSGNQAGALVSKGISALGTRFRAGMFTNESPSNNYLSFISVMASENQTQVTFSDLPASISLKNYSGSFPIITTLNKGESFIVAANSDTGSAENKDGLIGTLISSTKPIVVNSGSANGSFSNGGGRDFGIDQIVDATKIGNEYIFVKGEGNDAWENVLIVADSDNTEIRLNNDTSTIETIDAGEYYLIEGDQFSNGNLYVETSKNVFAYQGIGANSSEANQGLFFVPPLSCNTKGNLDNIASIDKIGSEDFPGGITIVTKSNATVTINNLPLSNFTNVGPNLVDGKSEYITYKVTGLSGNISVQCDEELYCAYFNQNNAATSGSFYSGFPSPPEINIQATFETLGVCIGNDLVLKAINTENFDSYEWYFDDGSGWVGLNVSTPEYQPTIPGNYKLTGVIACSGLELESPTVPVSICPDDEDSDGIIDNLDLDNDNDGLLNCEESFGNATIDLQDILKPVVRIPSILNETTTGNYTQKNDYGQLNNFSGTSNGKFVSTIETVDYEANNKYTLSFNSPTNIRLTEPTAYNHTISTSEVFIFKILPLDKNITLVDPDNRLLVDTNYDEEFETGITQFSGSEIHFKINPTPSGTTPYYFVANSVEGFVFQHELHDLNSSSSFEAVISIDCYKKDTDNDGIDDSFDLDSDNDAILDNLEFFGSTLPLTGIDVNQNGVDDAFEGINGNIDTDNDGVPNYLDLDSDNDGIYDLEESGSGFQDSDLDGQIDSSISVGTNGLIDSGETFADSGVINYTFEDTSSDGTYNFVNADSDVDGCSDVIEAGFTDGNGDGFLGNSTVIVDANGLVTNTSDGYQIPNGDYLINAPIIITTQPIDTGVCDLGTTSITIETNTIDGIYWEFSNDNGTTWNTISNMTYYTDFNTHELILQNIPIAFSNNLYRAVLSKNGNGCGEISDEILLTVHPLPIVTSYIELKQCDNDTDGFSAFNLNEAASKISSNYFNETFTFFESFTEAQTQSNPISDPTAFTNRIVNEDTIWALTTSSFGCNSISELKLIVSTTGIPADFLRTFYTCDDDLDINGDNNQNNDKRDGISSFDFSNVDAEIRAIFPVGQQLNIGYYRNESDALAETNAITDISNYRNIGYPGNQNIYVRVDSEIDNDCLGFGAHISLNVEALPFANPVIVPRQCDDDQDGYFNFDSSLIEPTILDGQSLNDVQIEYFDENGTVLPSPLPNPFFSNSQTITVIATNRNTNAPNGPCSDTSEIVFIVDKLPVAHPVSLAAVCDDDANSNDGFYEFDTSQIETELLAGQTGMDVYYFDENGTALPSPLPNPFNTATQTVSVEIVNPINPTCFATADLLFQVNPIPEFGIQGETILCITEPTSIITLAAIPTNTNDAYAYDWVDENGQNLSLFDTVDISAPGIYMVTATTTDGTNCSSAELFEIFPSEIAKITLDAISIVDDSDNNTITIDPSNLGTGSYEYSLDDPDFDFQDEPYFEYVSAGFHTIYIRDKNNCGVAAIEVSVLGFPKFFTPNYDGQNDTWHVQGVNDQFYPNSTIYIYDRFGKLLLKINTNSEGWDGFYNGILMPSTDYWFSAELIDQSNNIRIRKGHFSLIRR